MMLSKNFSLEEMTMSETATRLNIDNTPSAIVINNLTNLCNNVLEPLRELLGRPILITSGYRSPLLNQAIGGSKTSQHCIGQAADFHVNGMTVEELYQFVKKIDLPTDQVIQEFDKWCHVSFLIGENRRQYLRATKDSEGHTVYSPD